MRSYEQGIETLDVARETEHSLESMERYWQDYERVRMLLKRKTGVEDISSIIGRGQRVIVEYVELVRQFHLELFAGDP